MPPLVFVLLLLLASGCDRQDQPNESSGEAVKASNLASPESTPATEEQPPKIVLPETPPEDPALANLSPARRREYERGYRDCRTGNYDYDAESQGEYYRIGCMAAENLKAGAGP